MGTITKNIKEDITLVQSVLDGKQSEDIKARKRSEEAFATLFGKYKNQLLFKFKIQQRSEEDAEDFLMQTFEKAFVNIESYKPDFAFSTWLYSIARNLYIDHMRKGKDENLINIESCASDDGEGNYVEFEIMDGDKCPDEVMIAEERAAMVREAVKQIKNDSMREMVDLWFFQEKSYKEIAEITDSPLGTVQGNLNRAKKELERILLSINKNLATAY